MGSRFKRLTDLFVNGRAVPLRKDGKLLGHIWVQVINSYERDECLNDARTARARLVMALKGNGDERLKVEARLQDVGRERMERELAMRRAEVKIQDFAEDMRADPEWKERMEILQRTDFDNSAKPPTDEEVVLVGKINSEILTELDKRETDEVAHQLRTLGRLTDEDFLAEWMEAWLEKRSTELAGAEYRLTEMWFATRNCAGVEDGDGGLDHARCEGHPELFFDSKAQARAAPDEIHALIREALDELNMGGQDPKDSGSATSSSGSSATPSAGEESTASTSTVTPDKAPGT